MTIGIVGLGLIGSSIALAARRAWPDRRLIEVDRGISLDAVAGADIVVLATPVDVILDILRNQSHRLGDALILDTGSTKRSIVRTAREAGLARFVGGHPMAGAATSGPALARQDLFDGKPWFLVPGNRDRPALADARSFVEALGARPVVMSDDGAEHDRLMAAISHLPQVVASALMTLVGETVGERSLATAGQGLRDTTRLAASSAQVWESILATNANELRPLLNKLADDLREIAGQLEDPDASRRLFENANRYRRLIER